VGSVFNVRDLRHRTGDLLRDVEEGKRMSLMVILSAARSPRSPFIEHDILLL
jgi:hypothetical protein